MMNRQDFVAGAGISSFPEFWSDQKHNESMTSEYYVFALEHTIEDEWVHVS
jgi:hypothetical protein